jgi:hypothetical protein
MGAYYLRPDRLLTFVIDDNEALQGATVTGTVDAEHQAGWLVDGRSEFPVAGPDDGSLSLAIAGFACDAGMAVLHSHSLDAAVPLVITGDISASLSDRGGNRPNRIPWDRWVTFEPVEDAEDINIAVASNTRQVFIGELLVGERFELPDPPEPAIRHNLPVFALPKEAEFSAGNGLDKGLAGGRPLTFRQAFTKAQLDAAADGLIAWFEACRNGTLPTAFVPNSAKDDVIVGTLTSMGWEDHAEWVIVEFSMQEYLRQRWTSALVAT